MKIIFAGTPEVAASTLGSLLSSQFEVVAVLTRPDAPIGRKQVITPSPVAQVAAEAGIPVIKAKTVTSEVVSALADFGADIGVIVAYGAILNSAALSVPTRGWLNVHFSLLPRWRGAAPVQHAILAGDAETGVSLFKLDEGMDTGPVLAQVNTLVEPGETAGDLLKRLSILGDTLLLQELPNVESGLAVFAPQSGNHDHPVAVKIDRSQAAISWADSAIQIERKVRAMNPEPVAFTRLGGEVFRIFDAVSLGATDWVALETESAGSHSPGRVRAVGKRVLVEAGGGTLLELKMVQPAGKKPMAAIDWVRGNNQRDLTFEATALG